MDVGDMLRELCLAPAPSGYEKESAAIFRKLISPYADSIEIDRVGNVIATVTGTDAASPPVMVFAHMDQLGFIVRRIENDGFIQVDRLGGIPEKVLPALRLRIRTISGTFVPGVIGIKSHHATSADEKYKVDLVTSLFIDVGARTRQQVHDLGIEIGCPAIYEPSFQILTGNLASGTAIDNRGGCVAMVVAAARLKQRRCPSTVHFVGTVWEEFNIRGAVFAARRKKVDIAFCLDVVLAGDTPDLSRRYENQLGDGPTINLYSFHGRGTLNGTIPHEGLVQLAARAGQEAGIRFQRFASLGIITDSAYVQMENNGVACLDFGFPVRYTHSPVEVCCLSDIDGLGQLVAATLMRIDSTFNLDRFSF